MDSVVTVKEIGPAERRIVQIVLDDDVPRVKTYRYLARSIRRGFNLRGLKGDHEKVENTVRRAMVESHISTHIIDLVKDAIEKVESSEDAGEKVLTSLQAVVHKTIDLTMQQQRLFESIPIGWDDMLEAGYHTDDDGTEQYGYEYRVDTVDLKTFKRLFDKRETWSKRMSPDGKEEIPMPTPSAMQEAIANLDEAISEALGEHTHAD